MRWTPPSQVLLPVFWATFSVLSLAGVDARYAPSALFALLSLHLLLATCLYLALVVGRHLGLIASLAASVGAALVVVWHGRELTYRPSSLAFTVLIALILAAPIYFLLRADKPRPDLRRATMALAGCAILLAAGVFLAFQASPLLRWHLLRHNKMLGTPAYYLLADGIAELEQQLFDEQESKIVDQGGGKELGSHDIPGSEPIETQPIETQLIDTQLINSEPADSEQTTTAAMDRPPHLVFIMLDTLRADALAMGGGPADQMPRLNAFLEGAHRFTDVMANASWTRPSIASMWTGLLPEEHGARDVRDPLESERTTLAEVLAEQGYETAAFVSNVGAVGKSAGFAQGFDFFYEFNAQPYARAARIRTTVEQWLDQRAAGDSGDKPLFLYLHFLDPHDPYLAGQVPRSKSRAEYLQAYRAELRYLDEELGRTLELLDSRLPGPRAVLVTSDHGEEFGEHEEYGHGYSLYRELIHIPLALHTNDGGGELDVPLEGRDIFDLVTSWSNVGEGFDVPAWAAERGRSQQRYASIYYSSEGRLLLRPYLSKVCMRAVESQGYKLIWSAYGNTTELYNTSADSAERENLVGELPEVALRLQGLFDSSVATWTFPKPYERSPEEAKQLEALGYIDR